MYAKPFDSGCVTVVSEGFQGHLLCEVVYFPKLDNTKHSWHFMQIVRKCWTDAGFIVNRYPTVVSTLA